MGVVHLACDPNGRLVAVKVLNPSAPESGNARLRLAREVETMRRVRSPFVAEVLDADVTGEFPYIVTQYVAGPTLEEMVRGRGPLSGAGLRLLAHGTAEALAAIHAAGVVHRDFKPGNVMMADDRPVVIDFGIAQSPDATRLTQTGLVMGTPGYLAPEVIEGQPSSPASDVHSWGGTMAYAATGRPPFGGGSYETIFYRIISGRADLSGVPAGLMPVLTAALARDPARRPAARALSAQVAAVDLVNGAKAAKAANGANSRTNGRAYYPGPKQAARDVADLLPPVAYAPGPQPPPGWQAPRVPPGPGQSPAPAGPVPPLSASPRSVPARSVPSRSASARSASARSGAQAHARTTMAGLALMIAAMAVTLILPVAGLALSLAVITLLRAADQAQTGLATRRSVRGPRASDLLVVVVTAPLTVARALLTEALMAPLAFAAGAAVYLATLAVTHSLDLPRAGAYAAATVVAWYGVGPGSGRPRRQLNRMAGALARTPLTAALTAVAVWALAAAAVIFAVSQAPYYWPVMSPHLPTLHGWPFIGSHLPRFHEARWLLRHT
jgi:serine/threonine protein kinase